MYQIDNATSVTTPPAPTPAGTPGFFTDGSAVGGVPATVVPAEWLNGVQEELVNAVVAAGLTPSKTAFNQLAAAIRSTSSVVGSSRGLRMAVAAASATATLTAAELVVENSAGLSFRISNLNQAINLASTGAGGMDTGTAPTSGYVAIYAIYNPTTGAVALLGKDATSGVQPEVYGGSNMPAGYTASALVSVWPTNSSLQFKAGLQIDRVISIGTVTVLASSSMVATTPTALSITSAVPPNAKFVSGTVLVQTSTTSTIGINLTPVALAAGIQGLGSSLGAPGYISAPYRRLPISVPQTIYYTSSNTAGTPSYTISVTEFEF
ncbi:hypothetical protein [Luteibacter yeojuensis]|uniref:Uncharacterized protein n=1 Tax=Luteibacter yeojuensis TaxID=345309 RepID=A0A7X5QTZ4_9GAMM|nr:hypothetical protein [Luteibacter yeojuensis]NID15371.1 hypothetical protein [Luteibacter yeojuensis]